ncbi:CAMK family protein kinase [Tritrichomonas foetus]|uniref:CAMK family protein kinase n=1 Tax=Tritrichomonas foetus TaxID=1144522 RepID=A0A1J4KVT1_9EUKA|nr:CAMK family protein kinase [Tritrichomonas foetus]|eukprot:OHT13806.1 CAMK family protein kinase [Tritrichomonas foetus]
MNHHKKPSSESIEKSIPDHIGRYTLRGIIGTGAFSIVKLAVDIETQSSYACKIVPRQLMAKPSQESHFEQEIRIMQQMRYPNIVQLVDIYKDNLNFYLIIEFCSNGELFTHIIDNRFLSESDAKGFFKQLINALIYIHAADCVHRDLKPENLLLDDFGQLKVSDFGFSRYTNNSFVSTPCGSPCYASPECLTGSPYDGKKSDMWSCGIILFAMVTGQLPWTKKNYNELFKQITNG